MKVTFTFGLVKQSKRILGYQDSLNEFNCTV